jgi:hypothetical protein
MVCFPLFINQINSIFNTRILKTPLFASSPCFGKHHAIIISTPNNTSEFYLLDYSPISEPDKPIIMTRAKLLFGQTVSAEVRLRNIRNITDDSEIVKSHDMVDIQDHIKSQQISDQILKNIKQKDIREFIKKIKDKQDGKMNLYTYNCQHFCKTMTKEKEE